MDYYYLFMGIKKEDKNPPADKETPVEKKTIFDLYSSLKTTLTDSEKEQLTRKSIQKTCYDFISKEDGKKIAMDAEYAPTSLGNAFSLNGYGVPDVIYRHFCCQGFIGYTACAILKQNWIINIACTVPAEDAIRPDFELESSEKNDQETLQKIKHKTTVHFKINEVAKNLVINKKTFGQALAIPIFNDDEYDYSTPFNLDAVKPNTYQGFKLIEPYWTTPEFDSESIQNPAAPHFYEPTYWRLQNGMLVHRSQCVHITNGGLPDVLKPTYFYGGVPLPQMIYSRVYAAEKVANEAPTLAMTKRLYIMETNLMDRTANPRKTEDMMNTIAWYRDNYGILLKDREEGIQQMDASLTDLDALIMTQYQLVASIAQMPATKLLKTTPKGFNATGEFELKDYIQALQSLQENDMLPLINRHLKLYCKSKYGKDLKITAKFNPIDIPTQETKASLNGSLASMISQLVSSGIISPEEAREKIQSDEFAGFSFIDSSNPPENDQNDQAAIEDYLKQLQGKKEETPSKEEKEDKENEIANKQADNKG